MGNGKHRAGLGQPESVGLLDHPALCEECVEGLPDAAHAHAAGLPDLADGAGCVLLGEDVLDPFESGRRGACIVERRLRFMVEDSKSEGTVLVFELEAELVEGGCGTVFHAEVEHVVSSAAEIEQGVTPGVHLRGAAESLPGPDGTGSLACVVHEQDGGVKAPLELPEVVEQRSDIGHGVFIGTVQPDEGVEDEQSGLQALDRGL